MSIYKVKLSSNTAGESTSFDTVYTNVGIKGIPEKMGPYFRECNRKILSIESIDGYILVQSKNSP